MLTGIKVLNTNGEKIRVSSVCSCSACNRSDLVAVYGDGKYYIVNNYYYIDGKAYFKGEYIEVNKNIFYLMTGTYSDDKKIKLFGPYSAFYDSLIEDIKRNLKTNPDMVYRNKYSYCSSLPLNIIREEIQNRIDGKDPSIDSIYLIESLDKIYKPEIKTSALYSLLIDSIKDKDEKNIEKYAKLLEFKL